MSQKDEWNDKARDDMRATLRWFVLGEVRLSRYDHNAILEACRDIYLQDQCPDNEQDSFILFAANELKRAEAQLAAEQSLWPSETDCDRLDRVEATLRERGILLWQVSPCCDSCTLGEFSNRIDVIDHRHPGFQDRIRGYAFFIDQNMAEKLSENTKLSVYMGYGWLSADGSEVAQEVYNENALGIAREICECLQDEGFGYDWNGTLGCTIRVLVNWQRRTLLV
ncbi:hypothetical protein KIH39_20755 [Telmatocola sphagniphila]|uniref:DUF6891 domain-containing protein n=1 Tax=Telmatocola sphagniphila TaxID=1123043 RepID=A0A8E6EUH0_9BACT|nr:hypothetical protein [Telmatocola sphagniphila]QVL31252.1 hypothetical protein KIH39_20755 [Telmatocola sphagniphila]